MRLTKERNDSGARTVVLGFGAFGGTASQEPTMTERTPDVQDQNHPRAHQHTQDKLDDALDDSFPASDPPSITQPPPSKSDKKPAHKPG